MCSVKVEDCEVKATIGLVELRCGGIDVVTLGANTKGTDSGPPTPKAPIPSLRRKPIKEEEEEDPLSYLIHLFDRVDIDSKDSDSPDSSSEGDSDSDKSTPPSPRAKGFDKFYFYTSSSSRIYYYDSFRNVFMEDGTLIHDNSFAFQSNDILSPSFYIDGIPFWFDIEGLLSHDVNCTPYRVITWNPELELLDLNQYVDLGLSQSDGVAFQSNMNTGSYYDPDLASMSMPSPANCFTPEPKNEVLSPHFNPNSLQLGLQEGSKPLVWSPTSSVQKSPIVSVASRESSMGPSLFPESLSEGHPIVAKWQQEAVLAQQTTAKARSAARKPSKDERRRCPICNKMFRRPSSLDDHLNVHSGDKPHTCPFKGCNTGFATKSNMKRHFLTHRAGLLDQYRPGLTRADVGTDKSSPTKSGKVSRPTATYNSKSYHNGRFRIAA